MPHRLIGRNSVELFRNGRCLRCVAPAGLEIVICMPTQDFRPGRYYAAPAALGIRSE